MQNFVCIFWLHDPSQKAIGLKKFTAKFVQVENKGIDEKELMIKIDTNDLWLKTCSKWKENDISF
jgi:hypothetical protein